MSKKKSTTSNKLFATDLDFCPQCGTVLPLPGLEDVVTCKLCGFQIDVLGTVNVLTFQALKNIII